MDWKLEKERTNWLSVTLEAQRNNLAVFLQRLKGVAAHVKGSLSLNKKFMRLMNQVADEREKEIGIINEIEAIENRHHALRKLHMLRQADKIAEEKSKRRLKKQEEGLSVEEEKEEEGPHRMSFAEIIAIFWLLTSGKKTFSFFNFFSKNSPLSGEPLPQPKPEKVEPNVE